MIPSSQTILPGTGPSVSKHMYNIVYYTIYSRVSTARYRPVCKPTYRKVYTARYNIVYYTIASRVSNVKYRAVWKKTYRKVFRGCPKIM